VRDHRKLEVWVRARDLAIQVYALSRDFPSQERFGLTSQLRRAAVSVVANIAEGAGRSSDRDFARFVDLAVGSVSEVDAHLELAEAFGYVSPEQRSGIQSQVVSLRRKLHALLAALRPE
jgi:four helix bundle protein